ncbi:MAG TPA: histidine kinase, partial [Dermatophilaceae bacterium]|nr:histidine kinase [Dermatophilaceae bacterium]
MGGAQTVAAASPARARLGSRSRWTLRRRLVVVLIGLLVAVTGILGVVSTLALRGSLVGQLDSQLAAASQRAAGAPVQPGVSTQQPPAGPTGPTGDIPPGLSVPGQGAGTINLFVRDGTTRSGYIDQTGSFRELTHAQVVTLESLPRDGRPHPAHLTGLGDYRVVATTTTSGDVVVTGLSTSEATATVRDYLAVEAVVAALGIMLALVVGLVLVRRELRPLERVAATATRVSELPLDRGEVDLPERVAAVDTDAG